MYTSYDMFIETQVPEHELIISRTDLSGNITYANEIFEFISGYDREELVGKPHSIVRHTDMPKSIFKDMWAVLKSGEIWKGYVKNIRKDGGYYWVYAEVSGVYKNDKLVEYKSIRTPVEKDLQKFYQDLYDEKRKTEESTCRMVSTLNVKNIEKLTKYAKDEGISEDKILNIILEDYLL